MLCSSSVLFRVCCNEGSMSVNVTFLLALADPLQEGETAARSA